MCMSLLYKNIVIVDCGPLTDPANGQVDISSGTTLMNIASYSCDTGYTLTGSTERTCKADGMWSLYEPVCEGELYFCFVKL